MMMQAARLGSSSRDARPCQLVVRQASLLYRNLLMTLVYGTPTTGPKNRGQELGVVACWQRRCNHHVVTACWEWRAGSGDVCGAIVPIMHMRERAGAAVAVCGSRP